MNHNGFNYLPILFQSEMVKAILDGRKTQTRRLHEKPKYKVGNRLWVREKWGYRFENGKEYIEYADGVKDEIVMPHVSPKALIGKGFMPSIHMPFGAHRIELEVVGVKQERLWDISEEDAIAEGIEFIQGDMAYKDYINNISSYSSKRSFFSLWQKINGMESLQSNPLVTAYTFKRIVP